MKPMEAFDYFAQHKYAWPGGYPMFALMADGECLCHQCLIDNAKLIADATCGDGERDWELVACDVNWEDASLYCVHCNERIESAYAED